MTDLLSMLMHSRTQAHVFHLRVSPNGLAPHLALQTYYEGIIGLIDGIAESYQGMSGLIEFVHTERMQDNLKNISFIQNEIDNVEKLIYSTLYKLRNL